MRSIQRRIIMRIKRKFCAQSSGICVYQSKARSDLYKLICPSVLIAPRHTLVYDIKDRSVTIIVSSSYHLATQKKLQSDRIELRTKRRCLPKKKPDNDNGLILLLPEIGSGRRERGERGVGIRYSSKASLKRHKKLGVDWKKGQNDRKMRPCWSRDGPKDHWTNGETEKVTSWDT